MRRYEKAYLETTLECWEDIFKLPQRFMDKFVFRGQGDANWPISHSLERSVSKFYPHNIDTSLLFTEEQTMMKEFRWKYPLYSKSQPAHEDFLEWFTIMQHHGAPTRLVDITRSLFVAVYFATSEHLPVDSAVWAINGTLLRSHLSSRYMELHSKNVATHDEISHYAHQCANELFQGPAWQQDPPKGIYYIEPQIVNERLARQQGAFLMPANVQLSFTEHLMSHVLIEQALRIDFKPLIQYANGKKYAQDDIAILKINIPQGLNYEIGKYLRAMNLTAEMLFPGLDGLCKSVAYLRREGMGNPFQL